MTKEVCRQDGEPFVALRWLMLCSGTTLAGLLSIKGSLIWVISGIPLAAVTLAVLIFKFRFVERVFCSIVRWRVAVSVVLALYGAFRFVGVFLMHLRSLSEEVASPLLNELVSRFGVTFCAIAAVLSLFALFMYLYWFLGWFAERMRDVFATTDRVERWFMPFAFVIFSALILYAYSSTNVFSTPNANSDNFWDKLDIVYSSDSGQLTEQNVFFNVGASENDLRQPLFGAFAAPFALGVSLVTYLLPAQAYFMALQIMQAAFLVVTLMLIARLTSVTGTVKALTLVCFSLLYPTLMYLLNIEQYIFAVFWLIMLVWMIERGQEKGRDIAWVAASGSLVTSGVILLVKPSGKTWRDWLRQAGFAVLLFAAVMSLLGRMGMVLSSAESIRFLTQFTGEKLDFLPRLQQYVQFAVSCLVAPASLVDVYDSGVAVFRQAVVNHWSLPGILTLIATAGGFLLNRKRLYAQICAGWIALSFALLCLLGWGTAEHALVLYTHYFSWAFVSLIVMLIARVFSRSRAPQIYVLSLSAVTLAIFNGQGIIALIRFGFTYYPLH